MDDVGHFKDLVEQCDVAVGEVDRCSSRCAEIVGGTDGGGDDQIVDDFTIDLSDHLVGHQVREGTLSVDVVNRLEVLCGFEGPGGLELAGHRANRV